MFTVKRFFLFALATSAIIVSLARPAQATPLHPDLTVSATSISWDGVSFLSTCSGCFFSWTDPSGGFGGASVGNFQLDWNNTSSTGNFILNDLVGGSGITGLLLGGSVLSFVPNVAIPGPGATFAGTLALSTANIGFGNTLPTTFMFSSFDFSGTAGSADIDVIAAAVPEPTTLALFGIGGAILAFRLRRSRAGRTV